MTSTQLKQHVDFTEQSPTIISFCPGIRGLERGLERVFHSIRTVCYVEIETFIMENLLAAMEEGVVAPAPIWSNLKTFNPQPFRGRVAGIIGGYPCQPFSHAGNRLGTDDPRHLWPFIRQHIEVIQPGWCFFENVAGHLTLGFDVVKRELEEMGYFVEAGIYSAEEIGAPQKRERLFILGVKMGHPQTIHEQNDGTSESNKRVPCGRSSSELDDTGSTRGSIHEVRTGRLSPELASKELEHAHNGFYPRKSGQSTCKSEEERISQRNYPQESGESSSVPELEHPLGRGCEQCEQEGQSLRESRKTGSQLADTSSPRNEIGIPGQIERNERPTGVVNYGSDQHRFPAGQGLYQHPWEEPRTIESCVEYTIDGYNFTEDLHRAIGNSVVEQTAELAFRDLTSKIYNWFRYVNG